MYLYVNPGVWMLVWQSLALSYASGYNILYHHLMQNGINFLFQFFETSQKPSLAHLNLHLKEVRSQKRK